jgi:hypothetical protein
MVRRFVYFRALCIAKYRYGENIAVNPNFNIKNEILEILNPLGDNQKDPSYTGTAKLSKRHFI